MKPPCSAAATQPGGGIHQPHVDLVLDPDKLRIDVYLVHGTSECASLVAQVAVEDEVFHGPDAELRQFYQHVFEVRRRWYNLNRWRFALAGRLGRVVGAALESRSAGLKAHSVSRSLTTFAGLLAGRKHSASRIEWLAHLAGERGHHLGRRSQTFAALGFVVAAVRFRFEDATDLAWMPVDAVLRSRFLSGIFIMGPVLAVVLVILRRDGRYGLVLDIQDPFCTGVCTWGTIFGLRKYRKVKPPEPKPRRVKA
jgi:hypothetical protein